MCVNYWAWNDVLIQSLHIITHAYMVSLLNYKPCWIYHSNLGIYKTRALLESTCLICKVFGSNSNELAKGKFQSLCIKLPMIFWMRWASKIRPYGRQAVPQSRHEQNSCWHIRHEANTCCLNAQRKRRVMHIPGEKVHDSRELQNRNSYVLVYVRVSITYKIVRSFDLICNKDAEGSERTCGRERSRRTWCINSARRL